MQDKRILGILSKDGAIITDTHVVYTSGKHGSAYVNKDALYPHTMDTSRLCCAIAERFGGDGAEVVIAPALGGLILSQWVAFHLSKITGREVRGVYAEKESVVISDPEGTNRKCFAETGRFVIQRGYEKLIEGKSVLATEDILTTGGSARELIEAVRRAGGTVMGLGVLCNRGGITAHDVGDVPRLNALVNVSLDAFDEQDCPLCKSGVPINTSVGKGREFLARKLGK